MSDSLGKQIRPEQYDQYIDYYVYTVWNPIKKLNLRGGGGEIHTNCLRNVVYNTSLDLIPCCRRYNSTIKLQSYCELKYLLFALYIFGIQTVFTD